MNPTTNNETLSRREFTSIAVAAAGALVIGFHFPLRRARADEGSATVNAWLRITPDGKATLFVGKAEMGQGIFTALPMILAEDAELDWKDVSVEFAPSSAPFIDPKAPFTGGSTSVRGSIERLRTAGAAAREMLVAAAAARWSVPAGECSAKLGVVSHSASGRSLGYGELAAAASKLEVPANPKLKPARDFTILGKKHARLDTPLKVNGTAVFGIDVTVPKMAYAAVRTCPVFGGDVAGFDSLKKPDGTLALVKVPGGVAVVAESWWKAKRAAERLELKFDEGAFAAASSATISAQLDEALGKPGAVASSSGDAAGALASAKKKISATYEVPFLAHATMEPMCCTASVTDGACELWAPTQSPFFCQMTAAKILGIDPGKVKVNSTFLGGGFGRKAEMDFITQAILASKALGRPVKVVWTREEDIQHDFYRPAFKMKLEAGLDSHGAPIAWTSHSAGDSIMSRWFPDMVKEGLDRTSVEGAKEIHYAIPNQRASYVLVKTGVPVGFWRSVGSSQNAFFVESFIDELAHAAKKDPYEFRRSLLRSSPRHLKVLELAAGKAGWGKHKPPKGVARGIALAESFDSIVAEVAEVSLGADGTPRVHRVVCAIDCGPTVNPDTIEAQMQSGIVYGLTSALGGKITLENGRVSQSNFHDYPMVTMASCPKIEVHVVPSDAKMGGVGEPGVPPVAPAVCNALFALTGKRVRKLPLSDEDFSKKS